MTIKAITFDFWQTLYKNRPIDHNARLRQLKENIERSTSQQFSPAQIKAAVNVARRLWATTWTKEYRTLNAHEWLSAMVAALGTTVPPAEQQRIETEIENSILEVPPEPVAEIRDVLGRLAAQYRLGIISDTGLTPGRVIRQILEADNLLDYFGQLTFSDEIGRSKPHPDAFLTTLNALDARPIEAIHVGDLLRTDVAGAQNVGMRGVQYVGVNLDDWSLSVDNIPATSVTPDAVINSHTELEPLLKNWHQKGDGDSTKPLQ